MEGKLKEMEITIKRITVIGPVTPTRSRAPEHFSAADGPDDDGDGSDPLVLVFYKSC